MYNSITETSDSTPTPSSTPISKVVLVSGRVAEGEEELFKGKQEDGEDLLDFEWHEQIDQ